MNSTKSLRVLGFVANLALVMMSIVFVIPSVAKELMPSTSSSSSAEVESDLACSKVLSVCMKNPMCGGDLVLKGYNLVGKISSAEEKQNYIDKCFAFNSYFAIFDNNARKSDVGSQLDLSRRNNFDITYFLSYRQHVASKIGVGEYDLVELSWSYKGESFKTLAIASGADIVHDNVFVASNPRQVTAMKGQMTGSGNPKVMFERQMRVIKKSELNK